MSHASAQRQLQNHREAEIAAVLGELTALREEMTDSAAIPKSRLRAVHSSYRASAVNLCHYLALRRHDLRPLQMRLAALGLSSLGRAEPHVLTTVDAVLDVLRHLAGDLDHSSAPAADRDFVAGGRLLECHAEALLGPPPDGRGVRIMVTIPGEAAGDYALVRDLLIHGMDCMRINCAHDDARAWVAMAAHLRRAEQETGLHCRIAMDLAGPKLRTGPLAPGPAVVRVHPQRDELGRVEAPARVWLTREESPGSPPEPAAAILPVPAAWLEQLRPGERVRFVDARDAKRDLIIAAQAENGCWAEANQTAYLVPGTLLQREYGDGTEAMVGALPSRESAIVLHEGDRLVVTRDLNPGHPATFERQGNLETPAQIGCTLPEVFDEVRPGEPIWFDDGALGGVIEEVRAERVVVRIEHTPPGGAKLRADKGINLPDSKLTLAATTAKDLEDLSVAAAHADIVELSFANSADDVLDLERRLRKLCAGPLPGIVLKIETQRGFEHLPEMLLAAMRWPSCGVMIARGDLAVECGFERLAEVQEEILWICEAAHIPVIWATQVLENLAKSGMPSRAEITDAAMSHRAECVMLNKGPHVRKAMRLLDGILRRMQSHQAKKRSMLRHLRVADQVLSGRLS